jgi:hypothetical protein
VKEGRAKRLGKVIPYKRSELRSVEIIEGLCAKLSSYGTYKRIPRETQLRKLSEMADSDKADSEQRKRDQGAFERHCERLVEEQEQDIIRAVRAPPPRPPRTKWTRRVPHPVLIGHAASLTP